MSFEPEKFFVGVIDFFAVLMPGALMAYVVREPASRALSDLPAPALDHAESWIVLLFVSYLFGHVLFLVSSLLDDYVYDGLRGCTDRRQVERLVQGKKLYWRWARWMAGCKPFFDKKADAAVTEVIRLKLRALRGVVSPSSINAFQWSKARLSRQHRRGLATVERFEADSKFFRSFAVALFVLVIIYVMDRHWTRSLVCLAFVVPALWRYIDQRFKATQQAYFHVITLEGLKPPGFPQRDSARADGLSHAGGVVFRTKATGEIQFLLVDGSRWPHEPVLPKGHIEIDENAPKTAVREVREETGVWARPLERLADEPLPHAGSGAHGRFFLMEAIEPLDEGDVVPAEPETENRGHRWASLETAKGLGLFAETLKMLEAAQSKLPPVDERAVGAGVGDVQRGVLSARGLRS